MQPDRERDGERALGEAEALVEAMIAALAGDDVSRAADLAAESAAWCERAAGLRLRGGAGGSRVAALRARGELALRSADRARCFLRAARVGRTALSAGAVYGRDARAASGAVPAMLVSREA